MFLCDWRKDKTYIVKVFTRKSHKYNISAGFRIFINAVYAFLQNFIENILKKYPLCYYKAYD